MLRCFDIRCKIKFRKVEQHLVSFNSKDFEFSEIVFVSSDNNKTALITYISRNVLMYFVAFRILLNQDLESL